LVNNVVARGEQNWKNAVDVYVEEAKDAFVKAKRARLYGESFIKQGRYALAKAKELNDLFRLGRVIPNGMTDVDIQTIVTEQKAALCFAKTQKAKRFELARLAATSGYIKWANDEPGSYFPSAYGNGVATSYLRTHGDEVQTSRHASVPLAHAIRAYLFVKLCKERGKGYETNGHTVRLGHYTLDRITPKGDTYIGCHFFSYEVLEAWATKQGIAQANATDEALTRTLEVAS